MFDLLSEHMVARRRGLRSPQVSQRPEVSVFRVVDHRRAPGVLFMNVNTAAAKNASWLRRRSAPPLTEVLRDGGNVLLVRSPIHIHRWNPHRRPPTL